MITTVIFDMDGVIVNSEPIYFAMERDMFAALGIHVSQEEHNTFVGTPAHEMWKILKSKHGFERSVDSLVEDGRQRYRKHLESYGEKSLVPGVREFIINLQSMKLTLAVASSTIRQTVIDVLSLYHLEKLFPVIVGGDEVPHGKPAPDIFLRAAELTKSKPLECLVIEDSSNGVRAARAAGMKVAALRNPGSGAQDLSAAHFVFNSFSDPDLAGIVLKL
jgi:HAD superfamily hydrolase (TIGR01509 family)